MKIVATNNFIFILISSYRMLHLKKRNNLFETSALRCNFFTYCLTKYGVREFLLIYRPLFKKKFAFFGQAEFPYENNFVLSYFFGLLRREKYYFSLLRTKRLFIFYMPRRKVNLRRVPFLYRRFIRQFYFIRTFGRVYADYRTILKKTFLNSFISFDRLSLRCIQKAVLRLRRKKYYFLKNLRKRGQRRLRPWKFYRLRRLKRTTRKAIVHFGLLRIKRYLRSTGREHFVARYKSVINRWYGILKKQSQSATFPKYIQNSNYFSPLNTTFLKDFGFHNNLYHVFFKKKKNNFYLTLTNGFGEVIFHNSTGRLLKPRRNKKIRSSLLNLPGLTTSIVKKLVRKKITKVSKLYRPSGLSKRALKTIYNIFTGSGVVIKTLVKNSKKSHGFPKKTKKTRRL